MKLSRLFLSCPDGQYKAEVTDLDGDRVEPSDPHRNLGCGLCTYFETGTDPRVALASLKAWAIKGHREDIRQLEEGIAKLREFRL